MAAYTLFPQLTISLSALLLIISQIQCENYTISLMYPFTDYHEVSFSHYASSFVMAVEKVNKLSAENKNNITILYTIDDTNKNQDVSSGQEVKELESLRIITARSLENYDAFIGPGLTTCSYQGRLAVAYNKVLIGYRCNDAGLSNKEIYSTFARTASPDSYVYLPIMAVLRNYNWSRLAVINGYDEFDLRTTVARKKLVADLSKHGFIIPFEEPFKKNSNKNDNTGFFKRLKENARIIVFLNNNDAENYFLHEAYTNNMTNGDYVFLLTDTKSVVTFDPNATVQIDDSTNIVWGNNVNSILTNYRPDSSSIYGVIQAIKRSFWIASWVTDQKRYYIFEREVLAGRKNLFNCSSNIFICIGSHVPNEAAYLYNAVIVYYEALLRTKERSQNTRSGKVVMENAKGLTFKSVTGFDVEMNEHLDALFNMTLLSLQEFDYSLSPTGKMIDWKPFGNFIATNDTEKQKLRPSVSAIDWKNFPPPDTPECGFHGELCIKPTQKPETETYQAAIIAGCIIGVLLVGAMYGGIYIYRQRLILANMSWKIDGNEIKMAPSTNNDSRLSINTIMKHESEDDGIGGQVFTKIAFYKSQLVSVKTLPNVRIVLNRTVLTELRDMLDLSHENINPFLGMALHSNRILIIFQYCPKGSLQDVLANDDIKLDSMFLTSFVRDIVKGMHYLHNCPLKSFGRLKSSNCIVDSRWLIKITDFGTSFLRCGLNPMQECDVNSFYSSLLWTAPELLRQNYPPSIGTQKGDVYSFGIILQEIITRSEPYSMHDLEASDIIHKLKQRTDPPFRPAVQQYRSRPSSVGGDKQDDRELYNLMKMSYAEEPEARPTFAEIKKFLKKISTGSATNVFEHMVKMLEKYSNNLENVVEERTTLLIQEKKKTDDLIYRLLPSFVAEQLKQNNTVEAERYDESTIYFSDIVGFTTISGMSTPMQVVDLLNDLYTLFDALIKNYDVYKVETIGDAYMVVSGVPIRNGHMHAVEIADLSLHLLKAVDEQFIIRHMADTKLQIRIGIHSGPVAAGVVGTTMPRYCLFGDTVNKASRMESNGEELKIHISAETKALLDARGGYSIVPRDGKVHLKNVGLVQTYWLLEKRKISHFVGKKTAKVSPLAPMMKRGSPLLDKAPSKLNVLRRGSNWLSRNSIV